MEKNFNAIMYSDGKLWALPDWPEKPEVLPKTSSSFDLDVNTGEWIQYHESCEASIKSRVEFKPDEGAKVRLIMSGIELKEGEVYPLPAGYRIGLTVQIGDCKRTCTDGPSKECDCKRYALLLPIREEPERCNHNWQMDIDGYLRCTWCYAREVKITLKKKEDQPAKPEPTRKLVFDELIEWLNNESGFGSMDIPSIDVLSKAQSLRKKEEDNYKAAFKAGYDF